MMRSSDETVGKAYSFLRSEKFLQSLPFEEKSQEVRKQVWLAGLIE
jgi:hypothetical protein